MQCLQCQHENSATAKFCEECGTRMIRTCPDCGHEARASAKFCEECGTPLTAPTPAPSPVQPALEPEREPLSYTPRYLAEKILTSRSVLAGERKQVTVCFVDVKDSTELIKDLDPEEAQKLLDPAIHIMMDAVHRFEGTVNQVLGDGIMALFGAPIAHEDHAARACYAALTMQTAMRPYADEVRRAHGIEMRLRVGLNSGEVVVRTIGNDLHMDYSAVGPMVHLTARMEQMATPGTIRLTSTTLRLVEGLVQVNALGPIPIKGMTESVDVYELTGASTIKRRLQAAVARGLTTFVGRDTEIETLNQAQERAGAGHGQVVAAVGEAGVGKSRLLYEFVHSHRTQGWLVLESASVSYGKATPYFPVIDLLKRYVHIEEGDDSRTIRAKVTGHIVTLDESLQETIPALLSLLDALPDDSPFLQLDPSQRRQRTLDGLKRILLRESRMQALLLVFEDLHWIDSETQALLDSLVESLPTAPLLLLVNYRPEYQHGWGSKTYYTRLRLDPLPPESADALLAALLGDGGGVQHAGPLQTLKKLLIERTEGNPFFLEESVRTLVETQVLAGEPGTYRLAQELPTIHVPATVQAILAARMDRLPQDEKRLLQTAAVIGTEVPWPLLQVIAELSDEVLSRGLAHLQAAEFLYETSLFPERVYTFKHALTHEVAYGSLLHERRRLLHARIVEALEALSGDQLAEQVEKLAHHAVRGEVWDKVLLYCRQAGQKALRSSAYREAVSCFEQALSALPHLPEDRSLYEQALDLRLDLRNALVPLGDQERIFGILREAETLAENLDDHRRLGLLAGYMAQHFNSMNDYEQSIASSQHALALATTLGDLALQIGGHLHLGAAYQAIGDYRQGIEFLSRNTTSLADDLLYERFGRHFLPAVTSRAFLSLCLVILGEFDEGIARAEEGLQIAEAVASPSSLAFACYGVGFTYLYRGKLQRAMAVLERGRELCRVANVLVLLLPTVSSLGYAYALAGRVAEAQPVLEQIAERSLPQNIFGALWAALLSETYLLVNRTEDARRLATRTLSLTRTRRERGNEAWSLRLVGEIARHHDPPDIEEATTHYQQALALATEIGMRPLQAHCHRGLGTLYSQTGQVEQARAALTTAIQMYREMEMTFWLPETETALAGAEGKP